MNIKGKGGKRCADIDNRVPYVHGWAEDKVDRAALVRLVSGPHHVEGVRGKAPAREGVHWGMICDRFGVAPDEAVTWCDFHEVERPANPPASWVWTPPAPPPPKPKAPQPNKARPMSPNFKPPEPGPILTYHPLVAVAITDGTVRIVRWLAAEVHARGMRELPAIADDLGVKEPAARAAVNELKLTSSLARTALISGTSGAMLAHLTAHPQTRAQELEDLGIAQRDTAHKLLRQLAKRFASPAVTALTKRAVIP